MNINYLYSIIELYLSKESDEKKTNLSIIKKNNEEIEFNFNMDKNDTEVTSFVLPYEVVLSTDNLTYFIQKYKQKYIIIDEKYESNKGDNACYYYLKFNNGRIISFRDFSLLELNNIRNIVYNIKIQKEEIRIVFEQESEEARNNVSFRLQEAGFASYKTLFLTTIWFLNVFVLSLWFFKLFMQ